MGRFIYDLGNGQWDIPALRTLLEEAIPKEIAVHDFEVEHDFPAIGPRSMLLNARRFPPEGEHPNLVLLAIEDVTERRRSDAALQDSELRFRRLFQTAKDGILILDADLGTIIEANPFMCGLLGYELDDFLGKELWEIGLFRDKEANRDAYQELREKGYIRYEHLPLKTKGGDEVEVEFVSNLYMVGDRQVAQCNIRDITQRSRMEREAKAQAAALADLHRRKDEFLAMLSHELRNPLSPILNAVHLLRLQGDENLIQREARDIIERQVGQLSHLVDDLLEVARFTSGKIRLHPVRLDMRGVVERAVESARPLIDRRRHVLTVDVPEEPIWLHADPARLEQVVVNLLNNAAKYTDEGGRIWLEAPERRARDGPERAGHGDRHRPRSSSPTSSTCSRRRPGRWTARRAGWGSGCPWCNGSWRCTEGRWRSTATGWGEGASSRSASRCRSPRRRSRPRRPRDRPSDPRTPGGCWWSMTTWTRPRSWRSC